MSFADHDHGTVTGHVKWFDPNKGFGFVVNDNDGPDILLHANVLRNFGQGSVSEGSLVVMTVVQSDRGLQAEKVMSITPPTHGSLIPLGDMEHVTAEEIANCPVQPARVKWFDKAKGFGFANVFGDPKDVFLHIDVLRQSGLADLGAGEAVALRVMEGGRGLMAIEVLAWDVLER